MREPVAFYAAMGVVSWARIGSVVASQPHSPDKCSGFGRQVYWQRRYPVMCIYPSVCVFLRY